MQQRDNYSLPTTIHTNRSVPVCFCCCVCISCLKLTGIILPRLQLGLTMCMCLHHAGHSLILFLFSLTRLTEGRRLVSTVNAVPRAHTRSRDHDRTRDAARVRVQVHFLQHVRGLDAIRGARRGDSFLFSLHAVCILLCAGGTSHVRMHELFLLCALLTLPTHIQARGATSPESFCKLEQLRAAARKLEARCNTILPATQHTWYLHCVLRHIVPCMERFGQSRWVA